MPREEHQQPKDKDKDTDKDKVSSNTDNSSNVKDLLRVLWRVPASLVSNALPLPVPHVHPHALAQSRTPAILSIEERHDIYDVLRQCQEAVEQRRQSNHAYTNNTETASTSTSASHSSSRMRLNPVYRQTQKRALPADIVTRMNNAAKAYKEQRTRTSSKVERTRNDTSKLRKNIAGIKQQALKHEDPKTVTSKEKAKAKAKTKGKGKRKAQVVKSKQAQTNAYEHNEESNQNTGSERESTATDSEKKHKMAPRNGKLRGSSTKMEETKTEQEQEREQEQEQEQRTKTPVKRKLGTNAAQNVYPYAYCTHVCIYCILYCMNR